MTTTIGSTAELQQHIGQKGRFSLKVPSGSVAIRGTDGDVARVRDTSGQALSERFSIFAGPDHLALEARLRFGFGLGFQIGGRSAEDDLEIEVPRSATIFIDTASADVEATGLAGPKRFKTASGDISLADVTGELEVEAVSGDVTVDGTDRLDARVRTISGDLRLRAPSLTRLEAGTTSGGIRLDAELSGSGPFAVKSISGDMTIVSRGALSVEAQTITGDLVTALEHRMSSSPGRKTLIIGTNGPTLQFKSVSGDLLIEEPREAAASDRSAAMDGATFDVAELGDVSLDASDLDSSDLDSSDPDAADMAAARLEILRALERGELTVDAAIERLAEIEGAAR